MSSLYFYLRWPPVRILVDPLWKNVRASVVEKGDIPGWVVNVGSLWAGGTFVLSLVFFYFLVDLGKIHYKIDRVSLSIIPEVNRLIQSSMLNRLACPVRDGCALRRYVQTRSGERQFREVVFYYFANQDTVGSYNQRDKRRQVFGFWTQYYVFNYVMVIVLLCWLWICFLALLKAPTWITSGSAATSILILVFWWWRGREYRRGALELVRPGGCVLHPRERKRRCPSCNAGCILRSPAAKFGPVQLRPPDQQTQTLLAISRSNLYELMVPSQFARGRR